VAAAAAAVVLMEEEENTMTAESRTNEPLPL
jgi:hypothetical protein